MVCAQHDSVKLVFLGILIKGFFLKYKLKGSSSTLESGMGRFGCSDGF